MSCQNKTFQLGEWTVLDIRQLLSESSVSTAHVVDFKDTEAFGKCCEDTREETSNTEQVHQVREQNKVQSKERCEDNKAGKTAWEVKSHVDNV